MNGPALTRHHWSRASTLDWSTLRRKLRDVEGFNARLAVVITHAVGTMACAYIFTALALVGLPGAIQLGVLGIVQWVAQTFLQLVLLSIIMVGQQVQADASDARATKTFEDTEQILDRLDVRTAGGLQVLDERMARIEARLDKP